MRTGDLKVAAGNPIRAVKWNQLVDRLPTSGFGSAAGSGDMSRVMVQVLNETGADRETGEVVEIKAFD